MHGERGGKESEREREMGRERETERRKEKEDDRIDRGGCMWRKDYHGKSYRPGQPRLHAVPRT